MKFKPIGPSLFVSGQLTEEDLELARRTGFRRIVCNRPDDEDAGQPRAAELARAAARLGLSFVHIPVSGGFSDEDVGAMAATLDDAGGPVLAYCRTGRRSARLSALARSAVVRPDHLIRDIGSAGFDVGDLTTRMALRHAGLHGAEALSYDVVVVGGGSAGIATAASILKRRPAIRLAVIEPTADHWYQPGWTLVGAGVFDAEATRRATGDVIPSGADWIRGRASAFEPDRRSVKLEDGRSVRYKVLVVAVGLELDWAAIPGLQESLGSDGVTSNYRRDLAPYTHRLVEKLGHGRAIFTQPPMPIKCAGAPQKAMYLSCDAWRRAGRGKDVNVAFHSAATSLFGVAEYVPPLMKYVERYGIELNLGSRLVEVDGPAHVAVFLRSDGKGGLDRVVEHFDMLHVCPPQVAPAVVASSSLSAKDGFVAVDPATLRHVVYEDVFALGDVAGTTNAKTAAAARKQAPVVAENVIAALDGGRPVATYDGYGSCPLTVERGRIVLAEFGYGGKLMPSFPRWLLDGRRATRLAWLLKTRLLPTLYWNGMLKGREWLARPGRPG